MYIQIVVHVDSLCILLYPMRQVTLGWSWEWSFIKYFSSLSCLQTFSIQTYQTFIYTHQAQYTMS